MATVTNFKIDGQSTTPFREPSKVVINAAFGTEAQPSININSVDLVDDGNNLNSTKVRSMWASDPTKGGSYGFGVTNGIDTFDFDFFMDYRKMVFKSAIETSVGLIKKNSLDQFDDRIKGITQRLLTYKGAMTSNDFRKVPFIVRNRRSDLEKLQILQNAFNVLKSIGDEVHKIINIASDIPTLGVAPALVNLTLTTANIILLFNQLFDLFEQIQNTFFAPIKYHAGIKPKTFIEKACTVYMDYDSVNFGTLEPIMNELVWLGSKNNQKGYPAFLPQPSFLKDGLFNPSDAGFYLGDCIDILTEEFRLRRAIIDNVVHLRPENDPFWATQSGFIMPSVKVEQIFANNGTIRPNYEDLFANIVIEWATDDSDKWTLDDLIDEEDPLTTGKLINVTTIESTTPTSNKLNLLNQGKSVNIPHALAVRNSPIDDLFDQFNTSSQLLTDLKENLTDRINQFSAELATTFPQVNQFIAVLQNRTGALKIENEFFSTPKQMLLTTNSNGFPTIPANFADKIGAKALYANYHTWDSFIPGNRNPANPQQTAAKYIYENVKINFGISDFATTLNNAYFTTESGKIGKFTRIAWNVYGDSADVDYWIYEDWMSNIEENIF